MSATPIAANAVNGARSALVADPLGAAAERVLLSAGFEVKRETGLAGAALVAALRGRQALLVRGQTQVTADVIRASSGLKVIARAGAGTDNIDTVAAAASGIAVFNAPGANAVSVAEHVWGLIFSLLRHIPAADHSMREGRWEKSKLQGAEVSGRTLGLVGLGFVGREVAHIGIAFHCRVIGFDPDAAAGANVPGIERVDLDTVFRESDVLSLHAPLTAQTKHLADASRLALMKRGAILINAARGGLVDETALALALADGRLAGAGLDVFEQEPLGESPLLSLANVVVTPHLGGSTAEAQERAAIKAAEAVCAFLDGEVPSGRVV